MRVLSWSSPVWLSLGLVLSSASGCLVVKFDGTDSLTEVSLSDVLTDGFTQTSSPTDTLPTEPTETLTDPTDSTATDPTDGPPVCGETR